ncbi:MAG: aldehyde dehydrogenase family protein [Coxiella sp. (in: Bacteria)]|nr:MAG: aldehyde dehydrogenase family protein [Coxiella sp. (in: g-proteobacteria)]
MDLLSQLSLTENHSGACIGADDWLTCQSESLVSYNPTTAEPLLSIKQADAKQLEKIIAAADNASRSWSQVPAPQRGEVVRRIGERLRQQKDVLGSLISLEMGKSKVEGDGEVQEMIDMADFAVGQSRMLYGKTIQSERVQHRLYEQWLPLGVVGVITAFNFPMAVWAWNAFISAICGNTVIWRPSSQVPLCALAVQHICNDVLKEMGYTAIFSLFVANDHKLAEQLVTDKRIHLVSFTGSTKTGRHVNELVAQRLGKCLLELGGNNAIIVDDTADLELAIPAITFGAVGTAGQRCTTTRRLFLQDTIYDDVLKRLKKSFGQIKIGDPSDKSYHMGPLINEHAVLAFEAAIAEINKQKGTIICGGKKLDRPGYFVEPTIVGAQNDWPIVQRETFAPILYVMRYQTFEEALSMHNAVAQGLSSALFSQHVKHCEQFLSVRGSDCGIAGINVGTSGAEIGGAFGGEKDTGGGRESGSDAWKAYMRRQTVTINWGDALPLAQGIDFDL